MTPTPDDDNVELFRGMRADVDGRPLVAGSARGLGVRNPIDVWAISVSELGETLVYCPDRDQPEAHGFIEPDETMTLADHQMALAGTRPRWRPVPGVIEKSR
jgi:hypothetical protein